MSYPDINSLPNLAALLDVSVDELMQFKKGASDPQKSQKEIRGGAASTSQSMKDIDRI